MTPVPEEMIREGTEYTGKVCVIGARLAEEELSRAFERARQSKTWEQRRDGKND